MKAISVYLAIPYSFNPDFSFRIANKVSAQLMQQGYVVFSPISHSHPIADHLPQLVRTDSDWWMSQDLPWVEACDQIFIVYIGKEGADLVESSKGVIMELKHAMLHGKRTRIVEVNEHGEILNIRA